MGLCVSIEAQLSSPSRDKFCGCLYGLAVGDALGTALEFQKRDCGVVIKDMMGGGPHDLPPGFWTDDTSMALCIAESLCLTGRFDAVDQMTRYLSWYESGHLGSTCDCFDIGSTTHISLQSFKDGPELPYRGKTWEKSAGNGSLMRLAPIPMFFHRSILEAIKWAELSSKTTHAAPQCISAVQYYTVLVIGALMGDRKDALLSELYTGPYGNYGLWEEIQLHPEILEIAKGSFKTKSRDEIKSSGYVVHSLEAALWAFHKASSFAEGALLTANLADDSDTVCAIYGMLAGAFWGLSSIPAKWTKTLALEPVLALFCNSLMSLSVKNKSEKNFHINHKVFLEAEANYREQIYDRVKPGTKQFTSLEEFDETARAFELSSFEEEKESKDDSFTTDLRVAYRVLLSTSRETLEKTVAKRKLGANAMFAEIKKKPVAKTKKRKRKKKNKLV